MVELLIGFTTICCVVAMVAVLFAILKFFVLDFNLTLLITGAVLVLVLLSYSVGTAVLQVIGRG